MPAGVRAGIGSAVEGLAALGDARRLAETALRACPVSGGAVLLDEHLPDALVVSSPALAGALADRVLGPLDRLDPADRDVIVETLTAWLDADGSAQRARSSTATATPSSTGSAASNSSPAAVWPAPGTWSTSRSPWRRGGCWGT